MSLKDYVFGFNAESKAVRYLEKNGFKILERNFHSRFGEIDIIATKGQNLHFIEVKATNGDYEAIQRVTSKKMAKLIKTINFYLLQSQLELNYQLDLICVQKDTITMLENISI